ERGRRDLKGQRDRARHAQHKQPTRFLIRPMSPGLETLCFRVHDTHLLPIAAAGVRTIARDTADLGCLLESTSPGTDTIMEHQREERARALQVWTAQECRYSIAYASPVANLRTKIDGRPALRRRSSA